MKLLLERRHLVFLLLADGLAQLLGLGGREPRHGHGDAHDLLLVDHGAVGLFQDRPQPVVVVLDLALAVLARQEVGDRVHRAGPVQRHHGHDVREHRRLQLLQHAAHARRLHLEDAVDVRPLVQVEGRRVVERYPVDVDVDAVVRLDPAQRLRDDRQVAQAEEVHLEQPEVRDHRALVLRDDGLALGVALHGRVQVQRVAADHHARRVHALAAHEALEREGGVEDAASSRASVA